MIWPQRDADEYCSMTSDYIVLPVVEYYSTKQTQDSESGIGA
jgi:hypothetical protein